MPNDTTRSDRSDLNRLCQFAMELLEDVRRAVLALPLRDEQLLTITEVIDEALEQLHAYYHQLTGEN